MSVVEKQNYAFKKKKWKILAHCVDRVGFFFRKPPSHKKLEPRKILVVRLDQMGDIIQALPVFPSLKKSFPQARLGFLTTSLGGEVSQWMKEIDTHFTWDCPWFDPTRRPSSKRSDVASWIQNEGFDCILELRGDIRLITFFRILGVQNLVSFGATGGGFLLDVNVPWKPTQPAIDKNLSLVKAIGGTVATDTPVLQVSQTKPVVNGRDKKKFHLAIHPDAGTPAKRWPVSYFADFIERILKSSSVEIHLIGLNRELGEQIEKKVSSSIKNHMGRTSFADLIHVLRSCDGLLTNDSGPAHLMSALNKPVWILWSGTAEASIWSPRGGQVHLFQHPVPCAPCSLRECIVPGHPCLAKISVDEVITSFNKAIPA